MGQKDAKTILISGDLVGQTVSLGRGNTLNGQPLDNPTLPGNAVVTEGGAQTAEVPEELLDLGERIRRRVAAKLAAKGIDPNAQPAGGVLIGGQSTDTVVVTGSKKRVDRVTAPSTNNMASEERTLPFRAGSTITNSNMNGVQFDGAWDLKVDPATGQAVKKDNQFVYIKRK